VTTVYLRGYSLSIFHREKSHENINENSWSLDQDMNLGPSAYGVMQLMNSNSNYIIEVSLVLVILFAHAVSLYSISH
jgi:hypothetical protein